MVLQKKSFAIFAGFFRFCASGLSAAAVLNLLFVFYYRLPLHSDNLRHTSDYVWEAHAAWFKMTEGISWGRMDADGFNNRVVIRNPDVLILGSSHMEATNVRQNEHTASLLQAHLAERGSDFSVYNRGISGHHFLKCVKYLGENAKTESVKYAAIETSRVAFTADEIRNLFADKIDFTPSYSAGILFYLQRLPLFRLFYLQIHDGMLRLFLPQNATSLSAERNVPQTESPETIRAIYEKLFSYVSAHANGKRVIIFYHPTGTPTAAGNLVYDTDSNYLSAFSAAAQKYDISFIDLTAATDDLWRREHKTTHGFCTGTAFGGHLNRNGHAIAARALTDVISADLMTAWSKEHSDVAL